MIRDLVGVYSPVALWQELPVIIVSFLLWSGVYAAFKTHDPRDPKQGSLRERVITVVEWVVILGTAVYEFFLAQWLAILYPPREHIAWLPQIDRIRIIAYDFLEGNAAFLVASGILYLIYMRLRHYPIVRTYGERVIPAVLFGGMLGYLAYLWSRGAFDVLWGWREP